MNEILGFLGSISWIIPAIVVIVLVILAVGYVRVRYVIADANEAIVITGGRGEPVIRVGGGAFVPPFRKSKKFDLGLMTVTSTNEATQTASMVPVVVEWTAQLRADTSKDERGQLNESLRNAILGFTNYEGKIAESLQQTLEGEVRAVIATMNPEELVINKASFSESVNTGVRDSMADLGFKLVSLNIGKISDPNQHYEHLAAKDREEKRTNASNLKAEADQAIAVRAAEADNVAKAAEQRRDLAIAEQGRELTLRQAAIRAETDVAQADAEISGQLQRELRNQELATREGAVAVIREQQKQAAATARRAVAVTEAETDKERRQIEAEATAEVTRRTAQAAADAAGIQAQGEADAINRTTEARARQTRETGLAEAEVSRAKGEADAAALLAKGNAEAEVQRRMAEALAAGDGANLKVALAQIDRDTRVTVYTEVGKLMATVGEKATFVDMGGSAGNGDNLFSNVLGSIPGLLKKLDVQSEALGGLPLGASIGAMLQGVRDGAPEDAPSVKPDSGDGSVAQSATPSVPSVEQTPAAPVIPVAVATPQQATPTATSVPAEEAVVTDKPAPVEQPSESDASVESFAGLKIDKETLEGALAEAAKDGTSIAELATRFGVDASKLEEILDQNFTTGDLIDAGIRQVRGRSPRKR